MSKYYKNKISYNHVIIIAVIANFLLCYFLFQLFGANGPNNNSEYDQFIIELSKTAQESDVSRLKKELRQSKFVHTQSIEFIAKKNALDYFGEEIKAELTEKVQQENPFNDLLIFELTQKNSTAVQDSFMLPLKINPEILNITQIPSSGSGSLVMKSGSYFGNIIIYLFAIGLILFTLSIGLSMDFERNRKNLLTLITNGKDPKALMNNYRKKGVLLGLKSWIFGVFLFISLFYLIKYCFGVDFIKFDFQNMVIVSVTTLALVIFTLLLVVTSKINNLQKEQ